KLAYMLDFAECRGLVIGDYALAQLAEIAGECRHLEWVWVVGSGGGAIGRLRRQDFATLLDGPVPDVTVRVASADEPMQMLYTSGTTGDPKAILSPYARFAFVASLGEMFGLRAGDRPYTGLSLTHANAQLITLGNVLSLGLRGVFSRRFTKSR